MDVMQPDDLVQFYENWIPGIGECTELHDELHAFFGLDFTIRDEAKLLGFQLGHHPAGNFFHVCVFALVSMTLYPTDYRNRWSDVQTFYKCYLLGKNFQSVPYWFVPSNIFEQYL